MTVRVATAAGDERLEEHAAARLRRLGADVVLRCWDRPELLGVIRGGALDALVFAGTPDWLQHQELHEAAFRGVRVYALGWGGGGDPAAVRVVPLAGVDELSIVIADDVHATAPVYVGAERGRAPGGRLVSVWGPKGSPGRTVAALALSQELARRRPTLLIDGDTYGGDVAQLLGMSDDARSVAWAAARAAEGTASDALAALVPPVPGAPRALAGVVTPSAWVDISQFGWMQLLHAARAAFAYTVIDTGFCVEADASPYTEWSQGRNGLARTAVSEAQHVVAVCRADPVGVKHFAWGFDALRDLVPPEDVLVVANRVVPGEERHVESFLRRHLAKRPAAYIHEATSPASVSEMCREGMMGLLPALGISEPAAGFLSTIGGRADRPDLAGERPVRR